MPDRFSLVRWRDAKTDPPEIERDVMTDVGLAYCWGLMQHWEFIAPDMEGPCEPSVWCDPFPPGDDAPTLKDLQRAHDALLYASGNLDHGILTVVYPEECEASAARIRRAIEEAER